MAGDAVLAVGRDVTRERRGALRALGAFTGERSVVAGVAPTGVDGGVTRHTHGVGRKTCGRVGVTIAALNTRHWNMRRRLHAGGHAAVVAIRAIGVGRGVRKRSACPAGKGRSRADVTGDAVLAVGRNVIGERRGAQRTACSFTGERTVVTGIAPAGADGGMTRHAHGVGRKTCRRVGMAITALDSRHRNMRRRLHAGGGGAVMAARTVGVGGSMGKRSADPTDETRGGAGMAADAVLAIGRDMTREGCRTQRALGTFAGERSVVARVATVGVDGGMTRHTHGVGRKAHRRVDVAIAALNAGHRDMRRRLHTGRGGAVVAARTVGVSRGMGKRSADPAGESRGGAGMAADAVLAIGRDVTREGCRTQGALGAFAGERTVVTGVAAAGVDGRVSRHAHGVGRETCHRVGVAAAALNAGHRNMRRRGHARRGRAVVAT